MDDALPILEYLPVSFQRKRDSDYIQFLWQAFDANYQSEKYQFSVLAYHMLYMSFVYFSVWQIKEAKPELFRNSLVGFSKDDEKSLLEASSPFTFWKINESRVFRFLKLIGCDNGQVGKYAKLVKERNDIAHSNGNIFYNAAKSTDDKIAEVLRCMEEIQSHIQPILHECLIRFLQESWDIETREYEDVSDQIREGLIHVHYFSQKDIESCLKFDVKTLCDHENFAEIKLLFVQFQAEYAIDTDDESYWDAETRIAVEAQMDIAEWNTEDGTVVFQHPEEMRRDATIIESREALVQYLEEVAAVAFCGYCPRDSGEYIYECDENSVVEGVLTDYEERIEEIFSSDVNDGEEEVES